MPIDTLLVRLNQINRPMRVKVILKTLIALEKEEGKKLLYEFYVCDCIMQIARSQGVEIPKRFSELYFDTMNNTTQNDGETSAEIIEKTCKLFRAFQEE